MLASHIIPLEKLPQIFPVIKAEHLHDFAFGKKIRQVRLNGRQFQETALNGQGAAVLNFGGDIVRNGQYNLHTNHLLCARLPYFLSIGQWGAMRGNGSPDAPPRFGFTIAGIPRSRMMIQAGIAPMQVMKISGHTQMSTFARYVNADDDAVKRAAAAIDAFHASAPEKEAAYVM
ncbi:MAG: hypothetical protein ACKVX9_01645 [Blastocatellia bacterium]